MAAYTEKYRARRMDLWAQSLENTETQEIVKHLTSEEALFSIRLRKFIKLLANSEYDIPNMLIKPTHKDIVFSYTDVINETCRLRKTLCTSEHFRELYWRLAMRVSYVIKFFFEERPTQSLSYKEYCIYREIRTSGEDGEWNELVKFEDFNKLSFSKAKKD